MEKRDIRIDFLRGCALLMIFVDHVPNNPLTLLAVRSFAFSDAAELFFFLSGFVAAMVYGRVLDRQGFLNGAARVWRRGWDIYAAQMVLLVFVVASVCAIAEAFPASGYLHYFRTEAFVLQTEPTLLQSLILRFQPQYLDILPVYAVFFAFLPFVLVALRRAPGTVLLVSFLIYLGTQLFGWNFTTHPGGEGWFFDPLAWQFLLVTGAAFGLGAMDRYKPLLLRREVLVCCGIVAALVAVMQFSASANALFPAFPSLYFVKLHVDKMFLEPGRLVSFFALAILTMRWMPAAARMARSAAVDAVARLGRHSLAIFCIGTLLALPGHVLWLEAGNSMTLQVVFSLAGIAVLLGTAWLLDWTKQAAGLAVPMAEPGRSAAA